MKALTQEKVIRFLSSLRSRTSD